MEMAAAQFSQLDNAAPASDSQAAPVASDESWFAQTIEIGGSSADATLWAPASSASEVEVQTRTADDDWGALVPEADEGASMEAQPVLEAEVYELAPEDAQEVVPLELGQADPAALELARKRAQEELIREMQEALRRAGATSEDDWLESKPVEPPQQAQTPAEHEDWGAAVTPPPIEPQPSLAGVAPSPPPVLVPADPWTMRPPAPLVLGEEGSSPSVEDSWKVVPLDGSVEAALLNVESMEAVASDPSLAIDLPFEAEFETTFDAAPFDLGDDDLSQDPNDPAEAARLRRQRFLRRAMENMGTLGPRPVSGATPVPSTPPPSSPSPAPVASSSGETSNEETLRFAEQIQARFAALGDSKQRDHFEILGLPRDATPNQVKAAFLGAAKVFHPDRLPSSISHMAPQITSVFESIREAYEVLYDDQKRGAWIAARERAAQTLTQAQPGPRQEAASDPASKAAEHFKKGEAAFRKRDFLAADENFGRAFALDRQALYLAAQAWAIYMDPSRRGDASVPKQMMNEALRIDAKCDRAHYQLGVIARVENAVDRAERHFRDAVAANPKHLEANQELRLIEMRKKNAPKKGGFFR